MPVSDKQYRHGKEHRTKRRSKSRSLVEQAGLLLRRETKAWKHGKHLARLATGEPK